MRLISPSSSEDFLRLAPGTTHSSSSSHLISISWVFSSPTDLLACSILGLVLGHLLFFDLHSLPLWVHLILQLKISFQAVDFQIDISSLWTSPVNSSLTCFSAYLTFLCLCCMGISNLKCPQLRSQYFTPSVHQLLPLSHPHFDKWQHHCSSCSDQKSRSHLFLSHPEAIHQHILLVFQKNTQHLTTAHHHWKYSLGLCHHHLLLGFVT